MSSDDHGNAAEGRAERSAHRVVSSRPCPGRASAGGNRDGLHARMAARGREGSKPVSDTGFRQGENPRQKCAGFVDSANGGGRRAPGRRYGRAPRLLAVPVVQLWNARRSGRRRGSRSCFERGYNAMSFGSRVPYASSYTRPRRRGRHGRPACAGGRATTWPAAAPCVLAVAERCEHAVALEHDEDLLLGGVAVSRVAELPRAGCSEWFRPVSTEPAAAPSSREESPNSPRSRSSGSRSSSRTTFGGRSRGSAIGSGSAPSTSHWCVVSTSSSVGPIPTLSIRGNQSQLPPPERRPLPYASTSSPSGPATSVCAGPVARWTMQVPAAPRTRRRRRPVALPREPRSRRARRRSPRGRRACAAASSGSPGRCGCG